MKKSTLKETERGQALIETLFGVSVCLSVLGITTHLLYGEWNRLRCLHQVFEETHATLVGQPRLSIFSKVQVIETTHGFEGRVKCGRAIESLTLQKLEVDPK